MDKKIGTYSKGDLNLKVTENPKEGESLNNIIVNDNGTITFAERTYKINLIHLKTGTRLQGNLSRKEKMEIAQHIKEILTEKPWFFSKSQKAPSLNHLVVTDKRWFHHGVKGKTHIYSKGVEYSSKQNKIFHQIQRTAAKSFTDSNLLDHSFSDSSRKTGMFIPHHPLDVMAENNKEYIYTPFDEDAYENERTFPSKLFDTTIKIQKLDGDLSFEKDELGFELEKVERERFFPNFKPTRKGLNFFAPIFKFVSGTSDKYSGYTKQEFLKAVINNLGDSVDELLDKLANLTGQEDEDEIGKLLNEGLQKFMELKQQVELLNDKHASNVYANKFLDFSLQCKLVNEEQKKLLEALAPAGVNLEEGFIDNNDEKEDIGEIPSNLKENTKKPLVDGSEVHFYQSCEYLEKLIQNANLPDNKIGIVDGHATIVSRNMGISSRKANSDSAHLIVENILDRIDLLAKIAVETKDPQQKQRVRDLLIQIRGNDGWLNEVVENFPDLAKKISDVSHLVPETMEQNFTMKDLVEYVLSLDKMPLSDLFNGLPELNKHVELIDKLTKKIAKLDDQKTLIRAQNFVIAWIQHYQKYHAKNDAFVKNFEKIINAISKKLNQENNKSLINILKNLKVQFKQEDDEVDGEITRLVSIPLNEGLKVELGNKPIAQIFLDVKNNKGDVNALVNDIRMTNAYYLSKIKQNELFNQAWTKKDKAEKAPNVLALTEHFNNVPNFIISQILECKNLKETKSMIKYFVAVANELKKEKDLLGFMQIFAALGSANLFKILDILDNRSINENMSKWNKLFEKNKLEMRSLVNNAKEEGKIYIPFIGIYLGDLTFNDELSNMVKEENSDVVKINAKKLNTAAKGVSNILDALDTLDFKQPLKLNSDFSLIMQNYKPLEEKEMDHKYENFKKSLSLK